MTDLERARAIRKKLMYLASEIEDCAIIAAALKAEREQEREVCAALCKQHTLNLSYAWAKGVHTKTHVRFADLSPESQDEIRSEERGEKIAAEMIEAAIRARSEP